MAIFKCKMCGGTLEVNNGATVCECEYCGTMQTLPKLDDEKKANLYDRANHFRRNNDYDKAAEIYNRILNEDTTDAESYWSLVLCRYGIEYVEDPATHRRVPTVNRAQYTSIFADENYKAAIQNADALQKTVYEAEAKAIDEIQKGILEISQKEKPFDVFICYKETDNNGRRTPDSVLATDLYHQLIQEGFKVFFSRITLEDKLGTAYEPYIFAALNSAKVMVALGTKPEYFNAVWVRNEWSRFLSLISQGEKKMLIPAYRDMDPYDLPEEFSHLQAQDMSKLGFMQELIRGIKKILASDQQKPSIKETVVVNNAPLASIAPLLKRGFMFCEDGNWTSADEYFEKVLDQDPENADAYLGKLMASCRSSKREALKHCSMPFDGNDNYAKAIRFGDDSLKEELDGYIKNIKDRNETARKEGIYKDAVAKMASGNLEGYEAAEIAFASIEGYKNATECVAICKNEIARIKAEIARKKEEERIAAEKKAEAERKEAARIARIEVEKRNAAMVRAKKTKKVLSVTIPAVIVAVIAIFVVTQVVIPNNNYKKACDLLAVGKYDAAITAFEAMDGFKDADAKIEEAKDAKIEPMRLGNVEAKVGEKVYFGKYEQDNDTDNGKEAIEWRILDKDGNKVLLISEKCLDVKKYNDVYVSITWEKCTLRKWLNEDFENAAFSDEEHKAIVNTNIKNNDNKDYGTSGGKDTNDDIFLLSIEEAVKYFKSVSDSAAVGTEFAKTNRIWVDDNGNSWWWLRSPGYDSDSAAIVHTDGYVYVNGSSVYHDTCGIRPALWVDISNL
ncbi:MAG: DUF6273 domain-containing protein [Firmicutes bacterium]|nr:DUF6273 domain-containing protein [Bacillota bacterium]